jgi:hypothetical protein
MLRPFKARVYTDVDILIAGSSFVKICLKSTRLNVEGALLAVGRGVDVK